MKDYRDHDRDHSHPARPSESFQDHDSDEDPNATVPSSPTLFMKKTPTGGNDVVPSLHQLPNLVLPEALYSPKPSLPLLASFPAATSGVSLGPSSANLTPSTRPGQTRTQRKTSVSSQGSIDSTSSANSNKERQKTVVCSVASCDKKFYEVAHLRIHER
ncbi:hypothetical protein BGZ99_008477 [Dissophora globulifera]|uniref:C2H2-type domain-containing protein n=1 Tax=Dissophora globulifera TaxID=979702 RepID=A0A9P6RRD7_9FUNG|nr:hypothetical protein BGZ99_008477 [Dissophora globulifera]